MTLIDSLAEQATVTDVRAESTITLTISPGSSVCGRSMKLTAAVATVPPGRGTPTGTVTFSADDGPATPVSLCGGVATLTTPLHAGPHTVTASYTGDTYYRPTPLATLATWIWRTGF
ncbi:MAG: Ig-like domain-containing protein [Pseudonocardiaceae bacterium]